MTFAVVGWTKICSPNFHEPYSCNSRHRSRAGQTDSENPILRAREKEEKVPCKSCNFCLAPFWQHVLDKGFQLHFLKQRGLIMGKLTFIC